MFKTSLAMLAASAVAVSRHHMGQTRYRYTNRGRGSIAGRQHDDQREIARRARQLARIAMRQAHRAWVNTSGEAENGYMSRRGVLHPTPVNDFGRVQEVAA